MENKSLKDFLQKLLQRVPGLSFAAVSDRDGVVLVKVARDDSQATTDELALSSTFAVTTDQASKLGLGKNKTITSFFKDRVVVHINHLPLIVSLVGDSEVNVGALLALAPEIRTSLDPLKSAVGSLSAE